MAFQKEFTEHVDLEVSGRVIAEVLCEVDCSCTYGPDDIRIDEIRVQDIVTGEWLRLMWNYKGKTVENRFYQVIAAKLYDQIEAKFTDAFKEAYLEETGRAYQEEVA